MAAISGASPDRDLPDTDTYLINIFSIALPRDRDLLEIRQRGECSVKNPRSEPAANASIRRMFEEVSLRAPENAVGFVLWRIVQRYQREMDAQLLPLHLTHLQFVTLALVAWLGREEQVASQAALARAGGIHPMQLSQMLKTLEAKGFISRQQSAADSRSKVAVITKDGVATLRKAFPIAVEVQLRLFGENGRPGGRFLAMLRKLDRDLAHADR